MSERRETFPKFNEKLYDKVVAHILEEPKRMNMDRWVTDTSYMAQSKVPACGIVACLGGWAVALSKRWKYNKLSEEYWSIRKISQGVLGLTTDEADILFSPSRWPQEYRIALGSRSPGSRGYAVVVAEFAKEFKDTIKANRKKAK